MIVSIRMHTFLKAAPLAIVVALIAAPVITAAGAFTSYEWRRPGMPPVYTSGCGIPIKYYDAKTVPGWPAPRINRYFCGGSYPPAIPFR